MQVLKEKSVFISSERFNNREFVTITDTETGEILEQYWKQIKQGEYKPPPDGRNPRFYKVYATNWQDVIQNKRLTFSEVGLFMSLLSFLDWQSPYLVHPKTRVNLSCSAIAKLLGYETEHIRRALDNLCAKGMLAKIHRGVGCPCNYMLNSNIVHFGKTMRDLNDHKVFENGCKYNAPIKIKYRETVKN